MTNTTEVEEKTGPTMTSRQSAIYDFLVEQIAQGVPPTVREIGKRFGIKSPNGVMCHLKALEKKGFIDRSAHLSRAIRLTNDPYKILKETCQELVSLSTTDPDFHVKLKEIDALV